MIRVSEAHLGGNEIEYVRQVLHSEMLSQGQFVRRFESAFEKTYRMQHAIACSSGTSALHLIFLALGIGPGDLVVVPSLTYVATANAVTYTGARPVFCDVDLNTWQMDPMLLERTVARWNGRVRAIVPVHLYGGMGAMSAYKRIADDAGVVVIEDAAEGLGATFNTLSAGTWGFASAFSFYGNKIITCGEGGMVVTNDDEFAAKIRLYRGQGVRVKGSYDHEVVGYNYRLTDLQAAVGLAQFEQLESALDARRQVASWYKEFLGDSKDITLQQVDWRCKSAHWMNAILTTEDVVNARQRLLDEGIETRPVFTPLHRFPMYSIPRETLPVSDRIAQKGFCLPSHAKLTRPDVERICSVITSKVRV